LLRIGGVVIGTNLVTHDRVGEIIFLGRFFREAARDRSLLSSTRSCGIVVVEDVSVGLDFGPAA
jgi:hypothetical protein